MPQFYDFVDRNLGRFEDVVEGRSENSLVEKYDCEVLILSAGDEWWELPTNVEKLKALFPAVWGVCRNESGREIETLL